MTPNIVEQTSFEPYLRKAVQSMVRKHHPKYITDDNKVDKEFWLYFYGMPVYHKYVTSLVQYSHARTHH
jgi:hypothetical protein